MSMKKTRELKGLADERAATTEAVIQLMENLMNQSKQFSQEESQELLRQGHQVRFSSSVTCTYR